MNSDEIIAQKYLSTFGKLIFEPDGNIPPDFAFESKVGVEVRRLNQNYREGSTVQGLESGSISIQESLQSELDKFGLNEKGEGYILSLGYQRPMTNMKKIKKKARDAIESFEQNPQSLPVTLNLSETVEFKIEAKTDKTSKKYTIGVVSDWDSGGYVNQMYIDELNHCIDEKSVKVESYLEEYSQWWLVLVDHLCSFMKEDLDEILNGIKSKGKFDKVVLIDHASKVEIEI